MSNDITVAEVLMQSSTSTARWIFSRRAWMGSSRRDSRLRASITASIARHRRRRGRRLTNVEEEVHGLKDEFAVSTQTARAAALNV